MGLSISVIAQTPGTLKWSYPIGGSSSAAISPGGDTIYVGSADHNLYALNTNGTLRWSYATGAEVWAKPCVAPDGTIYVGSLDNVLYAINPSGTLKWTYQDVWSYNPIYGSCALGADGTIYFGSDDTLFHAVNPGGTLKWSVQANAGFKDTPAIAPDGTIYINQDGGPLIALNPNGSVKWTYNTDSDYSSPAIAADGTVYSGVNDGIGTFVAINPDGSQKWEYSLYQIPLYNYCSPTIGPDGTIYIGNNAGGLDALNPDATVKWHFSAARVLISTPAIASDGTIYIGTTDGSILAVDNSGAQVWVYATGATIYSSPVVANDGTVYVESTGGYFYALYGTAAPAQPTGLTATPGNARVVLNWNSASGATSYNVKRSTTSGGPYTIVASPASTSYTNTGLANGTTYYYVVSAIKGASESANSSQVSATPQIPPPVPTGLHATAGNAQVGLTWGTSSGATSYNLKRSTTSGGPYTIIANTTSRSYTDTGLANGTTYYYVVSALKGGSESANSSQVSATPQPPRPPTPTGLTATAGNAQVGLTWGTSSGATSYNLKRSTTSGGPYTIIANTTSRSYTDTGLANGTTYYYVVSAVNGGGESANSSQVSARPQAPPPVPTGLTATVGKAQVVLSWSASSGATSYNVKRSTTSGGPYTVVANTASRSFTDAGLASGTTYYYVVSALKGASESANSSQVTAALPPPAGCVTPPTGLVAWWRAENNANDSQGTNTGTLVKGVTYTNGMVGQGFHLNGTNQYVQFADSVSLKPTNVTVEAWVRLDTEVTPGASSPGQQVILFKKNTRDGNFEGYVLIKNQISGQDCFTFGIASVDGYQVSANSTTMPQVGVWYHVVGTYDAGTGYSSIYVNGVQEASTYAGFPLDYGTRPIFIGTTGEAYDAPLGGTVDEVSIYNRALTAAEIQSLYNAGSAGKCPP